MSLEVFQLNGKNALVTGSRRGLGAAIAVALAKAGANVGCHTLGASLQRYTAAHNIFGWVSVLNFWENFFGNHPDRLWIILA